MENGYAIAFPPKETLNALPDKEFV